MRFAAQKAWPSAAHVCINVVGEVKDDMQAFCGTDIKEWYTRTATSQSVGWVADLVATFKSSFPKV